MNGTVNDRKLMREEQGRRVLWVNRGRRWALTIVHVIDVGDRHELRLVNRDAKDGKPDLLLTQEGWRAIEPEAAKAENCRYRLHL